MNTIYLKVHYYIRFVIGIALILLLPLPSNYLNAQVANVTIDIPAPHGGNLGVIAGGAAFQSRTRNTESGFVPDGNVGFSVGLGDLKKAVGVVAAVNIFGLSNNVGEGGNFGSGTLDIEVNRAINDYIFVGAGVRSLTNWLPPPTPAPRNNRSFFIVGNGIIPISRNYDKPFSLLFITAGMGNGIYRKTKDFDLETSGKLNPFGSVALQVFRGGNAIVEWNGYTLNTGLSLYPFKKLPGLGGIFALSSLTEGPPRIVCSVGYFCRIKGIGHEPLP